MFRQRLFFILAWLCMFCGTLSARPAWVVEPGKPGPDLPPQGRSLFDHLTIKDGRQVVPFPYQRLLASLRGKLSNDGVYLGQPLKQVLIPLGRSLQRAAAAPNFFQSPRIVLAVDADPASAANDTGILLRDRLFIGYLEAADVLEIISYNEAAARFEFQVVTDYKAHGDPQVLYARRLVCMACHQNAAPIFSRPLWDETNTNANVSSELENADREFHGIPTKLGVDIAYAIDNSTDRANGFTLTQKLWQQGCGDAGKGASCRAALLTRALQYVLSGHRGFDHDSGDYVAALRQPMLDARKRRWPDGLWIPNPDIPNRKPLAGFNAPAVNDRGRPDGSFADASNISARSEPLAARPPKATWDPDPDAWVERAVHGLAQFLTSDDVRRIDAHLARAVVGKTEHVAQCETSITHRESTQRIKLDCRSDTVSFRGLIYRDLSNGHVSGHLRNLKLQRQDLGRLTVSGHQESEGLLRVELTRTDSPTGMRLSNGDSVGPVRLSWPPGDSSKASVALSVRHDFQQLVDATHRMGINPDSSLAASPFRRADTLPELFGTLGMDRLAWCCTHDVDLPPPQHETADPLPDSPLLGPFLEACAICHRSGAPFPPNFLAGAAKQAKRAIAQCAERIQYRLAMWDLAPDGRGKTPMPPAVGANLQIDADGHWVSGLLPDLRKALHEIAGSESIPLPRREETLARPYVDLRPCLPTI